MSLQHLLQPQTSLPAATQASGGSCSTPCALLPPEKPGIREHLFHSTCPPWAQVSWHPPHTPMHTLPMDPGVWGPAPPHTAHWPQGTQVSGRTIEVEVLADQGLRKDPQATGDGSWSGVLEGQTECSLHTPLQLLKQCQILCAQLGMGEHISAAWSTRYTKQRTCACKGTRVLNMLVMSPSRFLYALLMHVHAPHVPHVLLVPCVCAHRDAQAEHMQKSLPSHTCTEVYMNLHTHERPASCLCATFTGVSTCLHPVHASTHATYSTHIYYISNTCIY